MAFTSLPFYSPTGSAYQWKGLEHVMTISGIDGLTTGVTNILTVPTGYSFVVDKVVVRVTGVTGSATTGHVKLQNVTDSVDIIGDTTLTALTAAGKYFPIAASGATPVVAAGKVIGINVTTAYTVATVVTLSVDLIGYLI